MFGTTKYKNEIEELKQRINSLVRDNNELTKSNKSYICKEQDRVKKEKQKDMSKDLIELSDLINTQMSYIFNNPRKISNEVIISKADATDNVRFNVSKGLPHSGSITGCVLVCIKFEIDINLNESIEEISNMIENVCLDFEVKCCNLDFGSDLGYKTTRY